MKGLRVVRQYGRPRGLLSDDGRLELAGISYLNSRPILDALDRPPYRDGFRVDRVVPAEVARRVAEGEAALGLVPVAAVATLGDLQFVPGIAIGARGPVWSVLVVGNQPLTEVDTVLLDASSRTSVVLARLVIARLRRSAPPRYHVQRYAAPPSHLPDRTAALVIGDAALAARNRFEHVLDLGQAWFEWTGEPFVFAAWAGSPDALRDAGAHFGRDQEQALRDALREGLENRRTIARSSAESGQVDEATAYAYLTDALRFEFGDAERRGLDRFFREASLAGLLPRAQVQMWGESPRSRLVSVDALLDRAADGERLSASEAVRLGTEAPLFGLGLAADAVRCRKHPDGVVTYIVDRNVNYTNVCTTSCRFCAFYRPVGHKEGYVLSRDELAAKLGEVVRAGGVQILLQGGLNPDLPLPWYEDLFRWIRTEFRLGLHALSPEEILHLARMEDLPVEIVLSRLRAAGLDSVPGGGAEILVDRVRRRVAPAKCTSEQWLEVMRTAHHMGLRSSATMMYGTTDSLLDRVLHLVKLRELQDETHGFTSFFCWDYRHEQGTRQAPGDTGTDVYLRMQALARIVLDNFEHVGASWVTQGPDVGEVALRFGADDFGSVMFEENVVSSAGTTHRIDAQAVEKRIHGAGFRAVRRNVAYQWLTTPE